jgi:hypothetical protein
LKVYFLLLLVFITQKIPFDTEDESRLELEGNARTTASSDTCVASTFNNEADTCMAATLRWGGLKQHPAFLFAQKQSKH